MESLYRQFYEEGVKLAQLEFSRKYASKAKRVRPGVTPATPKTANDKFKAKLQKIIKGHLSPIKKDIREATRRIEKDMPRTTPKAPPKAPTNL